MMLVRRWLREFSGATSIEYAMIASLIAAVVVVGVTSVSTGTNSFYGRLGTAFNTYILPGR